MTDKLKAIPLDGRGAIALEGEDAIPFLQGLITNDARRLSDSRALYAALLTPQGKYLHDFFLAAHGGRIFIDCERDRAADLLRRLLMYRLRSRVGLSDAGDSLRVTAILGADPRDLGLAAKAGSARPQGAGALLVDPRHAGLGLRLIAPPAETDAFLGSLGAAPGDASDYEAARLGLGAPDGARDIAVEKMFWLEANAEAWNGVDFEKGCYVGQELTARTKYRANLKSRLFSLSVTGARPQSGAPVLRQGREIGEMRSANDAFALAYLKIAEAEEARAAGEALACESAALALRDGP